MHLFQLKTLFYLSFHAIGFLFCMISIFGIPGNIDRDKAITKLLMKQIDILLIMAWYGIPLLLLSSVVAFYIHYVLIGKILSSISLFLGIGLLLSMIVFYRIK